MDEKAAFILQSTSFAFLAVTSAGLSLMDHLKHAIPLFEVSLLFQRIKPQHSASSAPSHSMLEGSVYLPKPSITPHGTPCAVALRAIASLHSGAWVPSGFAQEWMPRRPPMYTTRVSPDTNSAMAHAEAQDAPGFTTVRIPPRASTFAAIASAGERHAQQPPSSRLEKSCEPPPTNGMLRRIAIAVCFLLAAAAGADAMNFALVRDQLTVHASGPIEKGDAAKFAALPKFNTLELRQPWRFS